MVYKVVPTGVLRGDSTTLENALYWYCARDGIRTFCSDGLSNLLEMKSFQDDCLSWSYFDF
nr:MAG TPA: hypothetical protein [Caudoviricetes sp.]